MPGGDLVAWACVLGALVAMAVALAAGRRRRFLLAAVLVAFGGVLLRGNLASRHWLSEWDERYHATVARNLADHPMRPTLVDRPFDPAPAENWRRSEVWLHKPPLALWLIAGSLRVFGENELAVRVPSLLLSGLGILLTFLLGRRLLGAPAGLLAAAIHAGHGRLAELAAGLRATDHVDHQLVVWVELGVWLALLSADALGRGRRRGWALAAATGLALGAALLTKSVPGWVIVGVLALAVSALPLPFRVRLAAPALAAGVGLAVQWPWLRHVSVAFPEQAALQAGRNARYFGEVVDTQGGPWWFYASDMSEHFGLLVPAAVVLFAVHALRHRALWPVLGWLAATYGAFSLAATKMTGYVLIAAPAVTLAMAWLAMDAWRARPPGARSLAYRALAVAVLASFLVGSAWRVHRPWRAPERRPLWAEELRFLGAELARLETPGAPWVVFNVPSLHEARFYTRATPVARAPTPADLEHARRLGLRVAVYGEPGDPIPPTPGVRFVPRDPRTREHRRIVRRLPRPPPGAEVRLWNARAPGPLEGYLERFVQLDARARMPDEDDIARAVQRRDPIVILLRPGAPDPVLPAGVPWIRIESEYAR